MFLAKYMLQIVHPGLVSNLKDGARKIVRRPHSGLKLCYSDFVCIRVPYVQSRCEVFE